MLQRSFEPDRSDFGGRGGGFNSSSVCTKTTELEADDGFLVKVVDFGGLGGVVASDGSYKAAST